MAKKVKIAEYTGANTAVTGDGVKIMIPINVAKPKAGSEVEIEDNPRAGENRFRLVGDQKPNYLQPR